MNSFVRVRVAEIVALPASAPTNYEIPTWETPVAGSFVTLAVGSCYVRDCDITSRRQQGPRCHLRVAYWPRSLSFELPENFIEARDFGR